MNSTALSIDSAGGLYFDSSAVDAWSCATSPGATGGGGTVDADCSDYPPLLDALAGAKKDLTHRVLESQKECLKGHFKQARHKLDEFIRDASYFFGGGTGSESRRSSAIAIQAPACVGRTSPCRHP